MEDYSQHEKLTVRLKELVEKYPMGVGIFKELLQNADDAGAERVVFVLDWRTHQLSNLKDPKWQELAGPALLAFNDQSFSEKDFEGLKDLGIGAKKTSLDKTGRFGQGFNAVYSLTDFPSFISDQYICFFDPHGFVVPDTGPGKTSSGMPSSGKRFKLEEFSDPEKEFSDPELLKVYEVAGLYHAEQLQFPSTLFRFPFRSSEKAQRSEISSVTFTSTDAEEILRRIEVIGPELLLFLKSVLTIEVWEIHENETQIQSPRIRIETINSQDVKQNRQVLLDILKTYEGSIDGFIEFCANPQEKLPRVSYTHEICLITSGPSEIQRSTWRVIQGFWIDGKDQSLTSQPPTKTLASELIQAMRDLKEMKHKAVPWGGAAACISPFRPVEGKKFCFLPLPEPDTTGLPIHIHGYFSVDSARRGETHGSSEDTDNSLQRKEKWNKLLWKEVISVACAYLVQDLVEDVGKQDLNAFYDFWPLRLNNPHADQLRRKFAKTLLPWNVICDWQGQWYKPKLVYTLPPTHPNLLEPLKADAKLRIAQHLPPQITNALKESDCAVLPAIEADFIRKHYCGITGTLGMKLESAPRPSLQRMDWIRDLLDFCLSDRYQNLTGLPFAVLADGTLHRFGETPAGVIYWANPDQRRIFASYPDWFLDQSIQETIQDSNDPKQVCRLTAQFEEFTPDLVAQRLVYLNFWQGQDLKAGYPWTPEAESIPNQDWIRLLFEYFASVPSPLPKALRQIPFVPSLDGKLYPGGCSYTPYFYDGNLVDKTEDGELKDKIAACLVKFQVPLIDTGIVPALVFRKFLNNRPVSKDNRDNLIHSLTAATLIRFLAEVDNLPEYEVSLYEELISYISRGSDKLGEEELNLLREIPIFPTETDELVSLNSNVALPPGGQKPQKLPPIPLGIKLIKTTPSWSQKLFTKLRIPILSESVLLKDHVLPVFDELKPTDQLEVLKWMRRSALNEALEQYGAIELKRKLAQTRLIRCTDGQLRTPHEVYLPDPHVQKAIEFLGDVAPQPDMDKVYKGVGNTRKSWLKFFENLGLLTDIRAQHLLDRANSFQSRLAQEGMEAVTADCLHLLDYLEENWDRACPEDLNKPQLKAHLHGHKVMDGRVKCPLSQALRSATYLPVIIDPAVLAQYPGHKKVPDPHRLYRPAEVVPLDLGNQIASQRYLLPRDSWPKIMKELDFKDVTWSEVVKHFKVLLDCWANTESRPDQKIFEKALYAVYDYLNRAFTNSGHWEQQREKETFVEEFKNKYCLWDKNGNFWLPNDVFAFEVSQVFGDRRLFYKSPYPNLYKALGQRHEITWNDYTRFLDEVQHLERGKVPDNFVKCVIASLDRMAKLPHNSKEVHKLDWILTEDNWLKSPAKVLIPDLEVYLEPIRSYGSEKAHLLHRDIHPDFAKKMGCTSLLNMEIEGESIQSSLDQTHAQQWQKQIRSPEFEMGVRRLLAHAGKHQSPDNIDLTWLKQCKVTLTPDNIFTNLWWPQNTNQRQMIAQKVPVQCYLGELQFYLVESQQAASRLAKSLNEEVMRKHGYDGVGVGVLHLLGILNCDPHGVKQYLDDERIQSLLDCPDVPVEVTPGSQDDPDFNPVPPTTPYRDRVGQQPPKDGLSRTSASTPSPTHTKTPSQDSPLGNTPIPQQPPNTAPPPQVERSSRREGTKNISPAKIGNKTTGRPQPNGGQEQTSRSGGGWFSKKTCIQAKREATTDDPEGLGSENRRNTGEAGVKAVIAYEEEQGRTAISMDEAWYNNPGYDIKSQPVEAEAGDSIGRRVESTGHNDIRYIEVKSFQGLWPEAGARLTRRQFCFGLDKGSQFWLYVVEYVDNPQRRKIHCIQNPAQQVKEFYFDPGWKDIAKFDAGQ